MNAWINVCSLFLKSKLNLMILEVFSNVLVCIRGFRILSFINCCLFFVYTCLSVAFLFRRILVKWNENVSDLKKVLNFSKTSTLNVTVLKLHESRCQFRLWTSIFTKYCRFHELSFWYVKKRYVFLFTRISNNVDVNVAFHGTLNWYVFFYDVDWKRCRSYRWWYWSVICFLFFHFVSFNSSKSLNLDYFLSIMSFAW